MGVIDQYLFEVSLRGCIVLIIVCQRSKWCRQNNVRVIFDYYLSKVHFAVRVDQLVTRADNSV